MYHGKYTHKHTYIYTHAHTYININKYILRHLLMYSIIWCFATSALSPRVSGPSDAVPPTPASLTSTTSPSVANCAAAKLPAPFA